MLSKEKVIELINNDKKRFPNQPVRKALINNLGQAIDEGYEIKNIKAYNDIASNSKSPFMQKVFKDSQSIIYKNNLGITKFHSDNADNAYKELMKIKDADDKIVAAGRASKRTADIEARKEALINKGKKDIPKKSMSTELSLGGNKDLSVINKGKTDIPKGSISTELSLIEKKDPSSYKKMENKAKDIIKKLNINIPKVKGTGYLGALLSTVGEIYNKDENYGDIFKDAKYGEGSTPEDILDLTKYIATTAAQVGLSVTSGALKTADGLMKGLNMVGAALPSLSRHSGTYEQQLIEYDESWINKALEGSHEYIDKGKEYLRDFSHGYDNEGDAKRKEDAILNRRTGNFITRLNETPEDEKMSIATPKQLLQKSNTGSANNGGTGAGNGNGGNGNEGAGKDGVKSNEALSKIIKDKGTLYEMTKAINNGEYTTAMRDELYKRYGMKVGEKKSDNKEWYDGSLNKNLELRKRMMENPNSIINEEVEDESINEQL